MLYKFRFTQDREDEIESDTIEEAWERFYDNYQNTKDVICEPMNADMEDDDARMMGKDGSC